MKQMQKISGLSVLAIMASASAFAAEGGEAKAGLPQLDTTLFPAQLFWLALTFATLYVLMAYVALPRVKRTLDHRSHVLSDDLTAAATANDTAKEVIAQYEKALADARAEAQATVAAITAKATKEAADQQAVQHRELAKHLTGAEAKITAARDAAISGLKTSATELAATVVERVTGMKGVSHG